MTSESDLPHIKLGLVCHSSLQIDIEPIRSSTASSEGLESLDKLETATGGAVSADKLKTAILQEMAKFVRPSLPTADSSGEQKSRKRQADGVLEGHLHTEA